MPELIDTPVTLGGFAEVIPAERELYLTVTGEGGVEGRVRIDDALALLEAGDLPDIPAEAIEGALADAVSDDSFADTDGLLYLSGTTLKAGTFSGFISSLFNGARKIGSAWFLSSLRIWDSSDNTKGLAFDLASVPTGTTRTFKPWNAGAFALLQDQKSNGTSGGASVSGVWATRVINTEVSDPDGIVSLASNQFTPTIDCLCSVVASFSNTSATRIRIYNVTDAVEVAKSPSANMNGTNNVSGNIVLNDIRVLAGKAYRVEYFGNAVNANGLGSSVNDGGVEVYLSLTLRGLAA